MIRTIAILIPLLLLMATNCDAKKSKVYWIDADVRVLAFVGKMGSKSDWEPRVYHTYERQRLNYIPKSRPGRCCRSFYLPGLVVRGEDGGRLVIPHDGWIVIQEKFLRVTRYKVKKSLKYETRRKP